MLYRTLITLFLPLLLAIMCSLQAQTKNYSLRLAEAYEKDGHYEEALEIYEQLYRTDSSDTKVIHGLKNALKILGRHDRRILLIQKQLKRDSSSIALLGEMIDAHYRQKNIGQAREYIRKALEAGANVIEGYQHIARVLFELRWYEESLRVYERAREKTKNDRLFILEIAGMYAYQGQFGPAAVEYLKHYRINPDQWFFVKSQLLTFPEDTSANRQVINVLKDDLRANPGDMQLNRFLIEFYIRAGLYENAFNLAVELDKKEKQNGISILQFAQSMEAQAKYAMAVHAYDYFIRLYPNAPQAEIGLAGCYMALSDSVIRGRYVAELDSAAGNQAAVYLTRAMKIYGNVIQKYPDTDWSIESRYRSGMIYLNRYYDYDRALAMFLHIYDKNKQTAWYPLAGIQIVECKVRQNKIAEALVFCRNHLPLIRDPQLSEQLLFMTGELYLYEGLIDSGLNVFQRIAQKQQGFYVNDALRNILLIQQGKKSEDALKKFIKAKRFRRQLKHHEALEQLTSLTGQSVPIGDEINFLIAGICIEINKGQEALRWLEELKERFPDSPLTDLSLKTAGDIYGGMGEYEKAVAFYKQIIIRYPKSIYLNEVRKRLRHAESLLKKAS